MKELTNIGNILPAFEEVRMCCCRDVVCVLRKGPLYLHFPKTRRL